MPTINYLILITYINEVEKKKGYRIVSASNKKPTHAYLHVLPLNMQFRYAVHSIPHPSSMLFTTNRIISWILCPYYDPYKYS